MAVVKDRLPEISNFRIIKTKPRSFGFTYEDQAEGLGDHAGALDDFPGPGDRDPVA